MLNLTQQERQALLFLIVVALIGLGANFAIKTNSRLRRLIAADSNIAKLNLNRVSREDLLRSRLLTPKLTERIIEYRNQNRSFHGLEELREIKGISASRYEKLKELFFVE